MNPQQCGESHQFGPFGGVCGVSEGFRSSVELDGDMADVDAHGLGEFVLQLGGEALKELGAKVGRDIKKSAVGKDDVDVLGGVGVIAASGGRGDAAAQARVAEGFQRVVDGGEADTGAAFVHQAVELLRGWVDLGRGEGLVDVEALLGAAEAPAGEGVTRAGAGLGVRDVRRSSFHRGKYWRGRRGGATQGVKTILLCSMPASEKVSPTTCHPISR